MKYLVTPALVAALIVVMAWLPISEVMEPTPPEISHQLRFEKAAQAMCGSEAAWADLGNGSVQCMTKHGRKTIKGEPK